MPKYLLCLFLLVISIAKANGSEVSIEVTENSASIENGVVRYAFDLTTGDYNATDLASGTRVLNGARFGLDADGGQWKVQPEYRYKAGAVQQVSEAHGFGKTLRITHVPKAGYHLVRTLTITLYEDQPFAKLGFVVKNQHAWPARIRDARLIDNAYLLPGKTIESPQALRGGAGSEANFVEPTLGINAYNSVMLTGIVEGKRHTLVAGGLGYGEFLRHVSIDGEKQTLTVRAQDPQGKLISPNTVYESPDTILVDISTVDPMESLERYGRAMRDANNAAPNPYNFPTLCGWLVSHGGFGEGRPLNNSRELVKQAQLATEAGVTKYTPIAVRLEPDYYCYGNFGDTQQGWWDDEHWSSPELKIGTARGASLQKPYETFTDFCGALNDKGAIPFTYFQCSLPSNDFAVAHPEWMLGNDISLLHNEHPHHITAVKYDYTDPEFQAYTLAMWERLRAAGMRGIKFDYPESAWCQDGGFEDKSYTTTSAYRKVFELCREGLGPDAYLHERNLGEYGTPRVDVNAGVVDLQRVWGDSSHFEPEMGSRMGLRWYKSRTVFGYYPDGKSFINPKTRKPHPAKLRQSLLTQLAWLSGRIELGTSFGSMTDDMRHDLTRVYPVLPGDRSPRPVDLLMGKEHPEVYVYDVNESWKQVMLCNHEETETVVSAPLSGKPYETGSLGFDADESYYVYDFWNDRFVGKLVGSSTLSVKLSPRETATYSIHQVADHPQFLSTNRHFTQGMVELSDVKWNAAAKTYSGKAEVIGGEPMRIVIALNGMPPPKVEASESATAEFDEIGNDLGLLILSTDENRSVTWNLGFSK